MLHAQILDLKCT